MDCLLLLSWLWRISFTCFLLLSLFSFFPQFPSVFRLSIPLQYFAREVWDDEKRRAAQEVHNHIDKFLPDDSSDGDDDDDDDDESRDAYSLS